VDLDFRGLQLPAGAIVQVLSHAAGTDPTAVPDPAFDITRSADRPPHLGFGGGVHHCLGHFVARTDMAVALPLLAQRMPDAVPDGPGEWLPVSGNTGALSFPIHFRPT
jgi:cytochrome P450